MSRPASIHRLEMGAILALALGIRIAAMIGFESSPFHAAPILDGAAIDEIARAVAGGDWTAGAPYFRPPLVSWILGAAYAVLGPSMTTVRLVNAAAGLATVAAVIVLSTRLGLPPLGRRVCGVAAALYGPLLVFEADPLAVSVATTLGAWSLVATHRAWTESGSTHRPWILAGVLGGLAGLARAPLALWPVVILALAFLAPGRRASRGILVVGSLLAVWSGPAAIMAAHGAGFRFPATQGGINAYVGNHPGADGRGVSAPGLADVVGWREFAAASIRAAARTTGDPPGPVRASGYWWKRAARFWIESPGDGLRLLGSKTLFLVHGYEAPNNRSVYGAREAVPWLHPLLVRLPGAYFPWGVLLPLAVLGAWTARLRREWTPVLLFAGTVLLPLLAFFVCARFRLPAVPALIPLAVLGAMQLRNRPRLALPAVVLFLVANVPWPAALAEDPPREHLARAEAAFQGGALAEAEAEYRRVLLLDPEEGRGYLGLSALAERRGDFETALAQARRSRETLPRSWAAAWAEARALDRMGRTADAVLPLQDAASFFPENPALHGALGLTLEALGRDPEARRSLERALGEGSRDPEVLNSAGRFRRNAGDREGARSLFDRALDIAPDHFKARFNRGLLAAEERDRDRALRDLLRARDLAPDPASRERVREALELVDRHLP